MYRTFRFSHPVPLFLAALLAAGHLAGCGGPRHLSENFGKAYHRGATAQIANPAAPDNPAPVDTLPGDLALQIYQQRYVKAMTEKQEQKDNVASELGNQ